MEHRASQDDITPFSNPKSALGDLDADNAAQLIAAASDIALLLDPDGTICDVALGTEGAGLEGVRRWIGYPWVDTVTAESRAKVDSLLKAAKGEEPTRWREINHIAAENLSTPIRYTAILAGACGRIVAIGRDLSTVAATQQRFVGFQQSMEREYARLRHAETRYRLLFQISSEAVIIVDANTMTIVDANPAVGDLLENDERSLVGKPFMEIFSGKSRAGLEALLATARAIGRGDEVDAALAPNDQQLSVSATLFRQERTAHFLVRLHPQPAAGSDANHHKSEPRALKVMEQMPDGFVVTDPGGRILTANAAFLEMVHLASEAQAKGQSIERWLGRPGVDNQILTKALRDHGAINNYGTILHSELGTTDEIEVSAVLVANGEEPCTGFVIRNVGRRVGLDFRFNQELPQSVDQLTELVGRVPLKELVREATDIIERLCIEAALKLTGDNRASAAQMLGLSRQSLYAKLRRYGISVANQDLQ